MSKSENISIAIVGSGGAGALTTGNFLLEAACSVGWYGLMTRTVGPQIRGGEAAALVRLATHPIECMPERYDLLIGIDWLNANRFGTEIDVGPHSLVISDPHGGELPAIVSRAGARVVEVPIKELAKAIPEGRANMIVLGIAAALLGLDEEALSALLAKRLAEKGEAAIAASRAGLKAGLAVAGDLDLASASRHRRRAPPNDGWYQAMKRQDWARSAAASGSRPLTRSRRRRKSWNGWRPVSARWAACCCRLRMNWPPST